MVFCIQNAVSRTLDPVNTIQVACLQLAFPQAEPLDARVERVSAELRAGPAADVYVLPELWDVGYFAFSSYADAARPLLDGPLAALAGAMAGRAAVVVAGSVLERNGTDLHNTVAVLGPDGPPGAYRKIHLFRYGSSEGDLLSPGRDIVVVETAAGRLGLATCYDLRFPAQFA